MPKRILVVEDDAQLRDSIKRFLNQEGFTVTAAAGGDDGFILAQESAPDLILTDGEMPGLDGHTLTRLLKKTAATKHVPVIIMTGAMIEAEDIVAGLEAGADDYLLKPYAMKVLLARIQAVLRRYARDPGAEKTLKRHGIELDPASREVRVDGKAIALTRKEFDVLAVLIERAGRVVTNGFLLETVWGYDLAVYNDPHTVETHISTLRRKLGPKGGARIVNLPGHGYKFEA